MSAEPPVGAVGAAPAPGSALPFLAALRFRYEWRTYQRLILEQFEHRDPKKRTFHIVAPPGSGKTLVGIEIARRIGRPAVAFAPTTTIQEQWAEKVGLFFPDGHPRPGPPDVSTDPAELGAFSSLTYQSLATQTQAREFLDRLGRSAWIEELVDGGRTAEGADRYFVQLQAKAPEVVARGVSLRARRVKRDLLAAGQARLDQLLHPNALALVERIVAAGIGCIILDEAHHLLDYWALILTTITTRLPGAVVVGLTATPPAASAPEELGNYLALVDGIDFEVPTPAVVRSGHLAPYQDLVLITEPTGAERKFLDTQHHVLRDLFERVFGDPRFTPHIEARINRPGGTPAWQELLGEEFDLAVAGARYLGSIGRPLAGDVELVPEMRRPPDVDDRFALLREWCLGFLRVSPHGDDRASLEDLRATLRTLGMVITETGWRSAPSPIDRVLAYSRSKVDGAVRILREESASMGERLRAVVLTDFERSSATALRTLHGVLDPESGGAVQAIRALVADSETDLLQPVMVTGRTVIVDDDAADLFLAEAARFFEERSLSATPKGSNAEAGLALIDGAGPDWVPRHYVAFVTTLFERGVTRCIVGTRGLLSEGWDSLSLNTLVDLTTAGTYASVNQIRGRSIRLDPEDPRKVANNWDVVCLARDLPEGRHDLERFVAKHRHTYGLGPGGRIVKGVAHVDHRLVLEDDKPIGAGVVTMVNRGALARARDRGAAYERWGVGRPYENFDFHATLLRADDLRLKTAFTWGRSLRALLNLALITLVAYLVMFLQVIPQLLQSDLPSWGIALVVGIAVIGPAALSAPRFWRYFRAAFMDLPVDSYLADFGRAVAETLRQTGLAPASPDRVRVSETAFGMYEIHLDGADPATAALFADAYADLFAPILDQRYLVVREETSLSGTFYRPVWYLLRRLTRMFRRRREYYHPVPSTFGRNRELAEAFGLSWARWVGGGRMIYTRSEEGARILLRERTTGDRGVTSATLEEWR